MRKCFLRSTVGWPRPERWRFLGAFAGATLYSYSKGEDDAGADGAILGISDRLREQGKRPPCHSAGGRKLLGALEYVPAAQEVLPEIDAIGDVDEIVVASGSALTHAGLLLGLRLMGDKTPVRGVCVRRDAAQQTERVLRRVAATAALMGVDGGVVRSTDVRTQMYRLGPDTGR